MADDTARAAVRQHLASRGWALRDSRMAEVCTGERGSCDCCPVAAWLAARVTIPDGARLCAGIDNAEVVTGTGDGEKLIAAATVPPVIASFIAAFDYEGLYPQLARPAGGAS